MKKLNNFIILGISAFLISCSGSADKVDTKPGAGEERDFSTIAVNGSISEDESGRYAPDEGVEGCFGDEPVDITMIVTGDKITRFNITEEFDELLLKFKKRKLTFTFREHEKIVCTLTFGGGKAQGECTAPEDKTCPLAYTKTQGVLGNILPDGV
ncbi:MAG TPA: hypothetical protein DDW49_02860 [Deltaproteobacteria bacterium]|nr:MAG: hypothetical protein A2048_02430 [Deltaproteobacteria bacterium GWA2_45_12]HBF12320.1 hypothetical protein [Deltaproteobacteria bacterium]